MKKAVLSSFLMIICFLTIAQTPESFNYQAMPLNSTGGTYPDQSMKVRISILAGSLTGNSVYTETFTTTTSYVGVINLQIGKGTPVSGSFSTIEWSSNSYFIKVEIDPAGGTSYVEMGVTQLLSVPYSMHSKTAATADYNTLSNLPVLNITNWNTAYSWGNHASLYRPLSYVPAWSEITLNPFSFVSLADNQILKYNSLTSKWENWTPNFLTGYNEVDPIWVEKSADYYTKSNMQTSGASQMHFNNLTNKPTTIEGYGITDAFNGTWANLTGKPAFATVATIGDFMYGGIVFYIDESGEHGLVCSLFDQSDGVRWHAGTEICSRATKNGYLAGEWNTNCIVNAQGYGDGGPYAAQLCDQYQNNYCSGWYLPSAVELQFLMEKKDIINAALSANLGSPISNGYYWSSTEPSEYTLNGGFGSALIFNINERTLSSDIKDHIYKVRAIRSF